MSGRPATSADDLDRPFLERYLTARLEVEAVRVESLSKFPRGASRETWFLAATAEHADGRRLHELVIRRDYPGGSICPMPLRREYEIYRRLTPSPVPVAAALWFEDDPARLGGRRPFYVRRRVEGDWRIAHLHDDDPCYDALRIAVAKEHLRKLAMVHTCDWQSLGLGEVLDVPAGPDRCVQSLIEDVERQLESFRIEPFPLFLEAREWLLDHLPEPPQRLALVKGTNGYGEEIFADGEIVAMSDWELARIGDPAHDWAQLQDFTTAIVRDGEVLWGLEPALDYYREVGGPTITPAKVDYYRKLQALVVLMFCHHAAVPLARGTDRMARLAWVATEVVHRAERTMAAMIGVGASAQAVPGQLG